MNVDLADKVALVTGAARGIGEVIVQRLVAENMHVYALDLNVPSVEGATNLQCDITNELSVENAVSKAAQEFGRVDVLVNNAGINAEGRLDELNVDEVRRCLEVNVVGTFIMTKAVAPLMMAAGSGRIINAASFAAIVPAVGAGAYAASKAAVAQWTRVLASELGPWNITVNSYAPGMVPTDMNGFASKPDDVQERLLNTLSLRRWGKAEEVSDLICFLSSEQSSYITGALIDVSGGKLATQLPWLAHDIC